MNKILSTQDIKNFLFFGYAPKPKNPKITKIFKKYKINAQRENKKKKEIEIIQDGCQILDDIFKDISKTTANEKKIIIPLSGGLDSRAILAGTLKNIPKDKIKTVTVGSPGSWDYDIANKVAAIARIDHQSIDLKTHVWDKKNILDYASKKTSLTSIPEGYLYSQVFGENPNSLHINGFMGDPLAGSHLSELGENLTWQEAQNQFIKKNNYAKNPIQNYPIATNTPFAENSTLSYEEQLDYFIRQRFYVLPIVLPKGFRHLSPLLDPRWIRFSLAVPREYRLGQSLYKKILVCYDQTLFSLETKNNLGLPLNAPKLQLNFQKAKKNGYLAVKKFIPRFPYTSIKNVNYIDFSHAYRHNKNIRTLIEESLSSLKARNILPRQLIEQNLANHMAGHDRSKTLSLLFSLEIYLSSGWRHQ